jgi:hypothetical protein
MNVASAKKNERNYSGGIVGTSEGRRTGGDVGEEAR